MASLFSGSAPSIQDALNEALKESPDTTEAPKDTGIMGVDTKPKAEDGFVESFIKSIVGRTPEVVEPKKVKPKKYDVQLPEVSEDAVLQYLDKIDIPATPSVTSDALNDPFAKATDSAEQASIAREAAGVTQSRTAPAEVYRIKKGDTLSKIAREYGTTVEELVKANGIEDPDMIPEGERLVIPGTVSKTADVDELDAVMPPKMRPEGLMKKPDPTNDSFLDTALNTILESEGLYQNDAEDSGNYRPDGTRIGTMRGITPAALAEYRGVDANTLTVEDMKGITEKEARAIYKQNYFVKPGIDKLPSDIQETVFDMYINAGGNAIKILQKAAGMPKSEQDGALGPKTLKAIQESGITVNEYTDARIDYYKNLAANNSDYKKYLKGWIKRANKYRTS